MEEAELLAKQLSNRAAVSRRFVEACEEWLACRNAAEADQLLPELPDASQSATESVQAAVDFYRDNSEQTMQLLAAENLGDIIVELVHTQKIMTRTPPVDAVEHFYLMGQSDAPCHRCGWRLAVFTVDTATLCAHCHFGIPAAS